MTRWPLNLNLQGQDMPGRRRGAVPGAECLRQHGSPSRNYRNNVTAAAREPSR
jgi:hypothetical protein